MRDSSPVEDDLDLREALKPTPVLAVVLVVLGVALFNWTRLDTTVYSSDQVYIATMMLKYRHADLFPGDPDLRILDFYPKSYIGVLDLLWCASGDIKAALFCLGTVLMIVFAAGMYFLLFDATGHPWIAAALAVASLWFRGSFGGSQWEVADFSAYLPRTITFAMAPWLLLACGRSLGRWRLVGLFAALGIAANFHTLSSMFLAMVLGGTLLLIPRARGRHIAVLAVSFLVFWIAAAPYFLELHRARRVPATTRPVDLPEPTTEQVEEIMRMRVPSLFLPPWRTVRWVGFHMALPVLCAAGGLWVRRRRFNDRDRTAVAFLLGTLAVAVGLAALLAFLRTAFGVQKSIIFMRAFRMVYLPLWIFCGWLIADLWDRESTGARFAAVLLVGALLVPASLPEYAIRWVKHQGKVPEYYRSVEADPDFLATCAWIKEHTPRDAMFLVRPQWHVFRVFAQRSMPMSKKGLALVLYDPALGLDAYERWKVVQAAYTNPSELLLETARRYGADYVLVYKAEIAAKRVFQCGEYRVFAIDGS